MSGDLNVEQAHDEKTAKYGTHNASLLRFATAAFRDHFTVVRHITLVLSYRGILSAA